MTRFGAVIASIVDAGPQALPKREIFSGEVGTVEEHRTNDNRCDPNRRHASLPHSMLSKSRAESVAEAPPMA